MIINSKELHNLTEKVSKVIHPKTLVPILETIKFELKDGELILTGSDIKTTLVVKSKVESKENISVCIPAKILNDTLKNIPSQNIDIQVSEKFEVTIKTEKGKFKIAGENPKDYLVIKEIESGNTFEIDSNDFKLAIEKTSFCISSDDLRPAITGLHFDSDSNGLTIVATDTINLGKYTLPSIGNVNLIIPKDVVFLLSNSNGKVSILSNKNKIQFSWDNCVLSSQLIQEKYPSYKSVIPDSSTIVLSVDKSELIGALKRVEPYSNSVNIVALSISNTEINVIAENTDYNNNANEVISCECNESIEIGINLVKLMQILTKVSGNNIKIEMNCYNNPIIITGENTNELFLIMPSILNK